jgi:glucosylceramidase
MKSEGLSDKKIIVWDHNRDLIYQRAETYFDDPEASKYAWGIGFIGTKTGVAVNRCLIM